MTASSHRTSLTHPLEIATVPLATGGAIGVTFCPGKRDAMAMTGAWDRDLKTDVDAIKAWGAMAVVCLMEEHELERLDVPRLGETVRRAGMAWYHLPIVDVGVPDRGFEYGWPAASAELHKLLTAGQRVLVHCKGGLGRSGMIAARLLVEAGEQPKAAIARVRQVRPGAIETKAQEQFVLACQSGGRS